MGGTHIAAPSALRRVATSDRVVRLTLGLALATFGLGAGWLSAAVGRHQAREQEAHERLLRTAHMVRSAVDAGLEELRLMENRQPFYLYNHFYSPPDVLAVNDPVALSPLSHPPGDPRIVGHFQLDPEGAARTPYESAQEAPSERTQRIVSALSGPDFEGLEELLREPPEAPEAPEARAREGRDALGDPAPETARVRRAVGAQGMGEVRQNALGPSGPLTVNLESWGEEVANDIRAAQAGSVEANRRVQARGRAAPLFRRQELDWDQVGNYGNAAQRGPVEDLAPPVISPLRNPSEGTPDGAILDNVVRIETAVEYTPMLWWSTPRALALHRVVSHEGVAVVQGVLLDRAHLIEVWIPRLIAGHGEAGALPTLVTDEAECALRVPASEVLEGTSLCFSEEAVAAVTESPESSLFELGLLLGLLALVGLASAAIVRAARRADDLSRQKSAFVSAVSHELRTPLTTLRMHAEMLEEGMVSEERQPKVYRELVQQSVRLGRLVENVLEISRLEEGKRPMRLGLGDLCGAARSVVASQRSFAEARGFSLVGPGDPEGPEAAPVELAFDAQAVEQIAINLIDNALKYAEGSDPPRIEVGVREEAAEAGEAGPVAVLWVRDHGPGIPEAEREKVFVRFHRVEREETAHMPGTGIGLALVRELAEAHGGSARALEAEGGGALIEVRLPIREGEAGAAEGSPE